MGRINDLGVKYTYALKKSSISRRWLVNGVGVVLIMLVLLVFGFYFESKSIYYNTAKQIMLTRAEITANSIVSSSAQTSNLSAEVRNVIENFEDKDKMTVMAINYKGIPTISSSGFSNMSDTKIPDYEQAMASFDGIGVFEGKLENGEKVIAVTMLLPVASSEYSAIRFISSTRILDSNTFKINLIFIGVCFAIMLCILISGVYFLRSIVVPIKNIGVAAKSIASGDYEARIVNDKSDELGELCDTINDMAHQLSITDRAKNEFISSVSHELRTPLTAIKGWGETLQMTTEKDTETIQRGMRVIINETERLSQMVEELLDFSRLQNGNFTMNKGKMDILAELGEAVVIYAERAKQDGIVLQYNEPVMMPFVYGDKNRLRQLFLNVIDNAIKYSDKGGTVTISATSDEENITILVQDTGCGIKAEDLPQITEKFFKSNHTRRGSGIGLAVANDIVKQHNGEMKFRSVEGLGTTVEIVIPIMIEAEETDVVKTEE